MATTTSPRTFHDLPDPVKTWLVSEQATSVVIALNKRLGLDGDEIKVIPRAVTQVVDGRLDPTQFIARLQQELGLNFDAARATAQEIYAKILKPVAVSLRNEGVDVALITEGGELARSDMVKAATPKSPPQRTPPPNLSVSDQPFILHRETPLKPAAPPASKPPEVKPNFRYKPQAPLAERPIPPAPPKAKIETPGAARVVHYSGPTTKLPDTKKS